MGQFVVDPGPPSWFVSPAAALKTTPLFALAAHAAGEETLWGRRARAAPAMNAQQLLAEISDYCRQTGLAESTFGRRAVNDGKLAARLRNGGRITTDTLDRIHGFMAAHPALERGRRSSSAPASRAICRLRPRRRCCNRAIRRAISASSTTGKSISCSSIPAARNGKSRTASPRSWRTSIRDRRRCACSTPASATARSWCG